MFELKYKITDEDIKALNKSANLKYVLEYLIVALLGLGVGIAAVIIRSNKTIFVMGIIIMVLGAALLVCAVLAMLFPSAAYASAVITSGELEREFTFDGDAITVKAEGADDVTIGYNEIKKVKNKKTYLVAVLNNGSALIIKDAITSGQTLTALFEFLSSKVVGQKQAEVKQTVAEAAPEAPEKTDQSAPASDDTEQDNKE